MIDERAKKRARIKKRKLWEMRLKLCGLALGGLAVIALVISLFVVIGKYKKQNSADGGENAAAVTEESGSGSVPVAELIPEDSDENTDDLNESLSVTVDDIASDEADENGYGPYANIYSAEKDIFFDGYETGSSAGAAYPPEDQVYSTYALLINAKTGEVIASKDSDTRINPASMTKIMTILVASERVRDLNDKVVIDQSITDYVWKNDCSAVNFSLDEEVTVEDVMYGTILPSGADAALALARYVAGSEEEFVVLMNQKLEELGLSDTAHFTNCTGVYDENHYCTLNDMAMIMKAAVENDLAKKILSAHKYTTSKTAQHEDGIEISNWFLRRIEDKDTHGEVVCAKTGFVNESGCCAASYEISNSGDYYICVTADAWSSWRCIYDHVAIYDAYVD